MLDWVAQVKSWMRADFANPLKLWGEKHRALRIPSHVLRILSNFTHKNPIALGMHRPWHATTPHFFVPFGPRTCSDCCDLLLEGALTVNVSVTRLFLRSWNTARILSHPDSHPESRLSCSLCVIKNQWWSVFFQNHNKAKSATKSRTCSVKGCLESKSEIPLWYSLNFFDRSTYFTWVMRSFYLQISIRMQRACAALQTISQQCRSCDPSHQGRQQIPWVRTGLVFRCGLTSRGANLVQFGLPWLSFGDFGEPPILGSQIMFRIAQQ